MLRWIWRSLGIRINVCIVCIHEYPNFLGVSCLSLTSSAKDVHMKIFSDSFLVRWTWKSYPTTTHPEFELRTFWVLDKHGFVWNKTELGTLFKEKNQKHSWKTRWKISSYFAEKKNNKKTSQLSGKDKAKSEHECFSSRSSVLLTSKLPVIRKHYERDKYVARRPKP